MNSDKSNLPFSQRLGFEELNNVLQINEINETLRIELWNSYYIFIQRIIENSSGYSQENYRWINKIVWLHFF